jgi:mRNA-degrading endonuclease toxin of MazEF toxin-antitoxin module
LPPASSWLLASPRAAPRFAKVAPQPTPRRGEIWFVQLPSDPPDKGRRPVVIVSTDGRNAHERASTVLVVPLTTNILRDAPTHLLLSAGETGLPADSAARAEAVTEVRKRDLIAARSTLRKLSNARVCELADRVKMALGCI